MNWLTIIFKLPSTLEHIMTNITQLAAALISIQNQLNKVQNEILGKIQELQDALVNVNLSPEAEQALADLVSKAQALDDIVPDQEPVV